MMPRLTLHIVVIMMMVVMVVVVIPMLITPLAFPLRSVNGLPGLLDPTNRLDQVVVNHHPCPMRILSGTLLDLIPCLLAETAFSKHLINGVASQHEASFPIFLPRIGEFPINRRESP